MLATLADHGARTLSPARACALAVIVPTFNETGNVRALIDALDAALRGALGGDAYEIIFVDDWSTDGTAEAVARIARQRGDVRLLRRFGRRGLSSAVIEGVLATTAPIVAVIDGDLQHDETILPTLYAAVARGGAEVAIGTRYAPGGSVACWTAGRRRVSTIATRVSRAVIGAEVSDPMSGFFVVRQATVVALLPRLSVMGFKILLDLLVSSPVALKVAEVPYRFRDRAAGTSKLDSATALEFLLLLLDKLLRGRVSPRLVLFAAVGGFGVLVHLALLRGFLAAGTEFRGAQALAVAITIAVNFAFNNQLTFRDRRLRGWAAVRGLLSFYLVCGLGAIANVGVGSLVYASDRRWWLAGIAGALVGSIWNYAASSVLTWNRRAHGR